jgi:hypothetical protein
LIPRIRWAARFGADEARFKVFLDVSDGGLFVQVPQALFAALELPFETQPHQFRGGMLREYAKSEQLPRLLRHRTVVEGCKVAENRSFGIAQRHPQKTFDSPHARVGIVREFLPNSRGVVAQFPVNHVFTWRARQSPLEIFSEAVLVPESDGAGPGVSLGRRKLRDECPARVNRARQGTDQRLKVPFAAPIRSRVEDSTQGGEFFAKRGRQAIGSV